MAWDDDLNDQQREAAGADRGHAVLLAGPGTGKTFVLVRRVQHLVEVHGVSPRLITALTFTRAAAAEMRERLVARLGDKGQEVRVSTLHSYALRELLRAGGSGIPMPVRVAGDWEERWVVVQELARMLGKPVSYIQNDRGTGTLDRLADDWESLAADNEGWQEGFPDPQFLEAWRRHREVYGYTLRSELVYQLLQELRSNPDFIPGETPLGKTEVLLVDEYQDLNRCDLDTVAEIARRSDAEVFASGDDDQSIYSFRHAHPAGIRGFADEYPGASTMLLTECMRCGEDVVELANWLINQELERVPKTLVSATPWDAEVALVRFADHDAEPVDVARLIDHEITCGVAPEEVLVLLKSDRHGAVSGGLDEALTGFGHLVYLPRSGGEPEPEVQRLLEYLLLSEELGDNDRVDDMALRALLELEDNNIGETRVWAITKFCLDRGVRFSRGLQLLEDDPSAYTSTGLSSILAEVNRIIELARELQQRSDEDGVAWLDRAATALGLSGPAFDLVHAMSVRIEEAMGAETEESTARTGFAQELISSITKLGETLPARLPGQVTVTTMHGAKGLSADVVIVLQAEDEVIPGDSDGPAYDEARRLLYVSLTRAKKKLYITACQRRTGPQSWSAVGQRERRSLTRFLRDYRLTASTVDSIVPRD